MADTTETKTYIIKVEDNLDEYNIELVEAKKNVDNLKKSHKELMDSGTASTEEIVKSETALRNANKTYSEAKRNVDLATQAQTSNMNSRKQLAAVISLEQAALGKLGDGYIRDEQGMLRLNPLYAQRVAKLKEAKDAAIAYDKAQSDGRSSVGLYSEALRDFNGKLGGTGELMNTVGGSIGGTTGQVTGFLSSLTSGLGPMGLFAAALGFLSQMWKNVQENIKLYLESADKLSLGTAGFDKDAEEARVDVRKRANGMIMEGYRIEQENMNKLISAKRFFYSEEEKAIFAQKVADAQEMQRKGRMMMDEVRGMHDKISFQEEYNKLLVEEEQINDEKLLRATEFEAIEAELTKMRGVVSDMDSTKEEKEKATLEFEKLSAQLLKDKTDFLDRQLANRNAIATILWKEEAMEDQINALLKEKNTVLKEYEADKIKVNRLERMANKDTIAEQKDINEALKEQAKIEEREFKLRMDRAKIFNAGLEKMRKDSLAASKALQAELKKAMETPLITTDDPDAQIQIMRDRQLTDINNRMALEQSNMIAMIDLQKERNEILRRNEIDNANKTGADVKLINEKYAKYDLELEQLKADNKLQIISGFAGSLASLFGEQTALGKVAAMAQATIDTYVAANKALASSPPPWNYIAMAGVIASGIANVNRIAAVNSGLPGGSNSRPLPVSITASPASQRTLAPPVGTTILTPLQNNNQAGQQSNFLTASDIAKAISQLPNPIVTVEAINLVAESKRKVEVRANI